MLSKFKKSLRTTQTDAESMVWYNLRNRYLKNHKFRRQHILHGYIVDFVCLKKRLIIELDGSQHVEQEEYDLLRTKTLENNGYTILRFWNCDVVENLSGVLEVIYEALK